MRTHLVLASLMVASPPANAFVVLDDPACAGDSEIIDGASQLVRIAEDEFSSEQLAAIEGAAEMWHACTNCVIRAAAWEFVIGAPVASGALNNGRPEVFLRDAAWFANRGLSNTTAVFILGGTACARVSQDIVVNEDSEQRFTLPWQGAQDVPTLQQTVAHEFGHWFGLDHEFYAGDADAFPTLMNDGSMGAMAGGDLSGVFRIHESEIHALRTFKGTGGSQVQVMLNQFKVDAYTTRWVFTNNNQWDKGEAVPNGDWLRVFVNTAGTTQTTVPVEWFLSTNTICSTADISLDKVTVSVGLGDPFEVVPELFVPANTPTGSYHLCAMVDPDHNLIETSENDNIVFLYHTIYVNP